VEGFVKKVDCKPGVKEWGLWTMTD